MSTIEASEIAETNIAAASTSSLAKVRTVHPQYPECAIYNGNFDKLQERFLGSEFSLAMPRDKEHVRKIGHRTFSGVQLIEYLVNHKVAPQKDGEGFLQGMLVGGRKLTETVERQHILALDFDDDCTIADLRGFAIDNNLMCVIYSSFNHLRTRLPYALKEIAETLGKSAGDWVIGQQFEESDAADFARAHFDSIPEGTGGSKVYRMSNAAYVDVAVPRKEKFRAVFFLKEPFDLLVEGRNDHLRGIQAWKGTYSAFADFVGYRWDDKCKNPDRLFYGPRHEHGHPCRTEIIVGNLLDLSEFKTMEASPSSNGKKAKKVPEMGSSGVPSAQLPESLDFKYPCLKLLGDHKGGEGFDGPLISAWNAFFHHRGVDASIEDVETFREYLLACVNAAVKRKPGRDRYNQIEYHERREKSAREYIQDNSNSQPAPYLALFERFGSLDAKNLTANEVGDLCNEIAELDDKLQRVELASFLRTTARPIKMIKDRIAGRRAVILRNRRAKEREDAAERVAYVECNVGANIHDLVSACQDGLSAAAKDEGRLFYYGGDFVRIVQGAGERKKFQRLNHDGLRAEINRHVDFIREDSEGDARRVSVPDDVLSNVRGLPDEDITIPRAKRFVRHPIFGDNGHLHYQPGFSPTSGAYLDINFDPMPVSNIPSDEENDEAWRIVEDIFIDFPLKEAGAFNPDPAQADRLRTERQLINDDAQIDFYSNDIEADTLTEVGDWSEDLGSLSDVVKTGIRNRHRHSFQGKASRANLYATLFTPFVADMYDGPAMGHYIGKPAIGSGSSLMVSALSMIWVDEGISAYTLPRSDEEMGKIIGSHLDEDSSAPMIFDNVSRRVDFQSLASMMTTRTFKTRRLQTSTNITRPVDCLVGVTGNNVSFTPEMARRFYLIHIDAESDKPAMRSPAMFLHSDLEGWIKTHRSKIIWAICTIVQSWVAAGMKSGSLYVGSFGGWSRCLSGILEHHGIHDMLCNQAAMTVRAALSVDSKERFLSELHPEMMELGANSLATAVPAGVIFAKIYNDDPSVRAFEIEVPDWVKAKQQMANLLADCDNNIVLIEEQGSPTAFKFRVDWDKKVKRNIYWFEKKGPDTI